MTSYKTIALIAAAGVGERVGGSTPKQYINIAGKSVLLHTIEKFISHPLIDAVRVIYNPEHSSLYKAATAGLDILEAVVGGSTRQESIRLGLQSIKQFNPEKVLIHDAARPFVSSDVITQVVKKLDDEIAVLPALPLEDTIKETNGREILGTVDRSNLVRAQTPQGFGFNEILSAHENLQSQIFTDDIALFEGSDKKISTVMGSSDNFKITTAEDIKRAKIIMNDIVDIRSGSGFDVHKFSDASLENNFVTICGVKVPYERELVGHSDADVGLHALTDAMLGAIGEGDIGEHFPPSDDKFKNMDSAVFVKRALELLHEKSATINNVDITIICERPKISEYKKDMVARIAQILQIDSSRVNVKATTTEKLGFTGRGEGVAAQALVTIKVNNND